MVSSANTKAEGMPESDTPQTEQNYDRDAIVSMPRWQFDEALREAGKVGAKETLREIGLNGDNHKQAAQDIADFRSIVQAMRSVRSTFLNTLVKLATYALVALLLGGIAMKSDISAFFK